MSIHAHPRATIDIDLLAPPDAVEQFVGVPRRHTVTAEKVGG
jgi:hypothetical protein